jgi:hypothetical protein
LNRNALDIDELCKNRKERRDNLIEMDKENSKLIIRVDRGKVFEINYNKRDDKFMVYSGDKILIQTVAEFNFHRDVNKLYSNLVKFLA